ncbi:MAG: 30S ribosomal protein S6 [Chloroflexota bacterium]|nr:30S ribosomal protein S6 [Chloroflexota bacterium]
MRDYELVLIISPEVTEEDIPAAIDRVTSFITARGGEIAAVDRWGKRRLAYPIKRFREGNYVISQVKLEPGITTELEANLQISENILRHLLVRVDN